MPSLKNQTLKLSEKISSLQTYYWESLNSTQIKAKELAKQNKTPFLVVADCQSQGRGRLQRNWESPAGLGLYFTLVFSTQIPKEKLPWISLMGGLALKEVLDQESIPDLVLKWPNDLLSQGKKLAGLLAEAHFETEKNPLIFLGLGLNVHQDQKDFSKTIQNQATSLYLLGSQNLNRASLLEKIILKILIEIKNLEAQPHENFLRRWEKESSLLGKEICFTWEGKEKQGRVLGLNSEGHLKVESQTKEILYLIAEDSTLIK
ncbi:MAG: biotin--[acetyl-CoA-carboxylase] ligase [Deltaproteobacteria bacterium]|nr:biotin--[acetyl-CoA-carboxylase] ligase [Deltaproteobacteria bacterium]